MEATETSQRFAILRAILPRRYQTTNLPDFPLDGAREFEAISPRPMW